MTSVPISSAIPHKHVIKKHSIIDAINILRPELLFRDKLRDVIFSNQFADSYFNTIPRDIRNIIGEFVPSLRVTDLAPIFESTRQVKKQFKQKYRNAGLYDGQKINHDFQLDVHFSSILIKFINGNAQIFRNRFRSDEWQYAGNMCLHFNQKSGHNEMNYYKFSKDSTYMENCLVPLTNFDNPVNERICYRILPCGLVYMHMIRSQETIDKYYSYYLADFTTLQCVPVHYHDLTMNCINDLGEIVESEKGINWTTLSGCFHELRTSVC